MRDFGGFVRRARERGEVVVQPRMGFGEPARMRAGLAAVAGTAAATAGTITVDSYTRLGDYAGALTAGDQLNGYPIVTTGPDTTADVVRGLGQDFQIQVRHGCPSPLDIVRTMTAAGLYATEGGPLSYSLPYSRTPVEESVENWRHTCQWLADAREPGVEPHLETFGGCLMGQLCPPELLIAVSVLEALFFCQHGLRSISLSYTQQTNHTQDREALLALRVLADEYVPDVDWHVVLYTYMGVFPQTERGARLLGRRAAQLAAEGGADRLIVKTVAEAHRIPTIRENVAALRDATNEVHTAATSPVHVTGGAVLEDARTLIESALELSPDAGTAMIRALRRGYLDIPFCLHPDNPGRSVSRITSDGRLAWRSVGAMPLRAGVGTAPLTSAAFLADLAHVAVTYDELATGTEPGEIS